VTTQTVQAPASGDINAWLKTVPDGSIVEFPAVTYSAVTFLSMTNRKNLVLHGNGTKVKLTGQGMNSGAQEAAFLMYNCSHIEISGTWDVTGSNPNTTTLYTSGHENQFVLGLSGWYGAQGCSYVEMTGVTARNLWTDFAYIDSQNQSGLTAANHVWIHHNTCTYMGRNAISTISGNDVLVEDNTFDKIGMDAWDIEPNFSYQEIRRNTFRRNHIGTYSHMTPFEGWLLSTWNNTQAPIEDITVDACDVVGNPSSGHSSSRRGLSVQVTHSGAGGRPKRITVTNCKTAQAVAAPAMQFANCDGVTEKGNVQPGTTPANIASFSGCTGVVHD